MIHKEHVREGATLDVRGDSLEADQVYQRLLRAFQDIQAQIQERVRPVAELAVQAEIDRLRSLSEQQKSILTDRLAQIDQSIMKCRNQIDEYRQVRSNLAELNERLTRLGAEPVLVPDFFSTENLGEVVLARIEGLRAEGKI